MSDRLMGHPLEGFKGTIYDPHKILREQRERESEQRAGKLQLQVGLPKRVEELVVKCDDLAAKYDQTLAALAEVDAKLEQLLLRPPEEPPRRRPGRPPKRPAESAEVATTIRVG
ncbi:MAG: hypothetical protein ACREEM_41355 [Blastocatellia bacterium]